MRLRVEVTIRATARTCSLTPETGLPEGVSDSAWKLSYLSVAAQFSALMPATTEAGQITLR